MSHVWGLGLGGPMSKKPGSGGLQCPGGKGRGVPMSQVGGGASPAQ